MNWPIFPINGHQPVLQISPKLDTSQTFLNFKVLAKCRRPGALTCLDTQLSMEKASELIFKLLNTYLANNWQSPDVTSQRWETILKDRLSGYYVSETSVFKILRKLIATFIFNPLICTISVLKYFWCSILNISNFSTL